MSDTNNADANFDGIPDRLQTFLTQSDFKLDWSNRRKVIFRSLIWLGLIFTANSFVVFYCILRERTLNAELAGLATSLMWATATVFITIIGAYLGTSQIDVQGFRSSITDMVGKLAEARKPA